MIGCWNKSVILTYVGLISCVIGITTNNINYAFVCLIVSGVCDLFDGTVARMCKRTEQEKQFGIQLDSLNDVLCFLAQPITIFLKMGYTEWYHVAIYILYACFGVARLAYFNISTSVENPVKYYTGLPVTLAALIYPLTYTFLRTFDFFNTLFPFIMLIVSILFVSKIKIKKPNKILYILLSLLAITVTILLLV